MNTDTIWHRNIYKKHLSSHEWSAVLNYYSSTFHQNNFSLLLNNKILNLFLNVSFMNKLFNLNEQIINNFLLNSFKISGYLSPNVGSKRKDVYIWLDTYEDVSKIFFIFKYTLLFQELNRSNQLGHYLI